MDAFNQIISFLFITRDGGFNWDIVSNLLTSVSLVLVSISILQVRKQRRESYKPLLALHDEVLYLQKNVQGVPANITTTLSLPKDIFFTNTTFRLSNIGLASSVKTRVTWFTDQKRFIAELSLLNEDAKLVTIQDFEGDVHITYESILPGFNYSFSARQGPIAQNISFVKNEESVEIRMPESVSAYLCLYQYLKIHTSQKINAINEQYEIPGYFRIEYEDISGNKYASDWKIEVDGYLSKHGWGENHMTFGQMRVSFHKREPS